MDRKSSALYKVIDARPQVNDNMTWHIVLWPYLFNKNHTWNWAKLQNQWIWVQKYKVQYNYRKIKQLLSAKLVRMKQTLTTVSVCLLDRQRQRRHEDIRIHIISCYFYFPTYIKETFSYVMLRSWFQRSPWEEVLLNICFLWCFWLLPSATLWVSNAVIIKYGIITWNSPINIVLSGLILLSNEKEIVRIKTAAALVGKVQFGLTND